MPEWVDAEGTTIKTVGDLRRFLERFGPADPVHYTDGDRVFTLEGCFARVHGQEHPGKKWDVVGVFFNTR